MIGLRIYCPICRATARLKSSILRAYSQRSHPIGPQLKQPRSALSPFKSIALSGASNAWAALPGRSATRGTLLANDPHLELTAPSIWYLARLELSTGGVIGGTIPGLPLVLVGRSAKLGWGSPVQISMIRMFTSKSLTHWSQANIKTPQGYKPFIKKQSIVRIKDKSPVTLEMFWTDNGPVLPGSHANLGAVTPAGHVTSVAWTLLSSQDTSVEAGFDLMAAQSVQEGLEASRGLWRPVKY